MEPLFVCFLDFFLLISSFFFVPALIIIIIIITLAMTYGVFVLLLFYAKFDLKLIILFHFNKQPNYVQNCKENNKTMKKKFKEQEMK